MIKTTQPDEQARNKMRDIYVNGPDMLISIGHTVAMALSTITAVNNHWCK